MNCSTNTLAKCHPLNAIRRDFERQMGLRSANQSHGLTITETDDSVVVGVDVPGIPEDSVSATIHDGHLLIEGERSAVDGEESTVVYNERAYGKFRRVVRLDDSIDPDSVDAVLEHGVLTLTLSRRPEVQPTKIEIRSGN